MGALEAIEEYLEIIRQVIVKKSSKDYIDGQFNRMIEKALKIDNNKIEVILASLDVIGDTQEAITSFYLFGLKDDIGEKYIRLYGVLNAIYIHSQAVISLARFFKVDNISTIEKNLKNNTILDIRHKLGAHSVNYLEANDSIACFTPIRMQMEADSLTFYNMNPQSSESETINLYDEIDEYLCDAQAILKLTATQMANINYRDGKEKLESTISKINVISLSAKESKWQHT